jgi:asparagine synthetase B (glutamine-hydrolysing)
MHKLASMLTKEDLLLCEQHILYRQKEQFSDGVGYSWIDGLKDHANEHVFHLLFVKLFINPQLFIYSTYNGFVSP